MNFILFWLKVLWKSLYVLFYLKWFTRNFFREKFDCFSCLSGKTALITGGNSGIGYATAVLLASKGCRIIIACRRDATKQKESIIEITGNTNITTKHLDLSKFKSIRQFSKEIIEEEDKIDILVNNAGMGSSSQCCTEDGLSTVMQVNYVGHVLLTYLLVDKLRASTSPRVIFVSSVFAFLHYETLKFMNIKYFDINPENLAIQYFNSKLCNILAAQVMSDEFAKYGIKVTSIDPGAVRTPLFKSSYSIDMERAWMSKAILESLLSCFSKDIYIAAEEILYLASSKDVVSGLHYFGNEPLAKPDILKDRQFCRAIWKKTKEWIMID